MKKAILTLVVLSLACFVQAQQVNESKVPVKIKDAFNSKNPEASLFRWEKQKNNYKAVYKGTDNAETTALYSPSGKLIEREFKLSSEEWSTIIVEYLSNVEPKQTLNMISVVMDADGHKSYKAQIHGMYYFFDSNESFVRKINQ